MVARKTRSRIIDAAIRIVRENAPTKLTLDEAARQAGLSKGGVLYHFASKDELIEAMIERLVRDQETRLLQLYEQEPQGPYRWLRAYVRYFFDPGSPGSDPASSACLAAMALNPAMLKPVNTMMKLSMKRIMSDAPDRDRAALISMGLDGLFLNQAMGFQLYDDETLARLRGNLLSGLLAGEDETPGRPVAAASAS
ncbi:TetR family transcriptional regulator [Phaeovibrio sulfidiphilus]|uniref:TetR family transcriptional regulator n=1 Tax=Phaeovibrio sulfidiphilus TaxID=1220600 RepID=A0A8J6YN38_9PROT|nr:TetR/AcrR family transcriptional regulator [Phaeovibrio sulfidiphilus]MBE1236356.1 TetR family transcriptional regulator [Phaeovibrio sulfidiphilus]